MAQITINIPDADLDRVLGAFADAYGWTESSGLTRAQFAKQQVIAFVRDVVRGRERSVLVEQVVVPPLDSLS